MTGRRIPLSLGRRLIGEVSHFALRTPNGVMERAMDLGSVLAARKAHPAPPSWIVLFAKAWARTAEEVPALRRCYVRLPWPGLYEHPTSVVMVTIERDVAGEPIPLFGRLKHPEFKPLAETDTALKSLKTAPLSSVREFAYALRTTRLPLPLRRGLWWLGLNIGPYRIAYFGTVAISVTAPFGAEVLHAVSPLGYCLSFGHIGPGAPTMVRLSFDHRITDGTTIARALARIEEVLNTELAAELAASA